MNASCDEDGSILHWHILFFREANGKMTWMLSRPNIEEIEYGNSKLLFRIWIWLYDRRREVTTMETKNIILKLRTERVISQY